MADFALVNQVDDVTIEGSHSWTKPPNSGIGISKSGQSADPSGQWRHYWSADDTDYPFLYLTDKRNSTGNLYFDGGGGSGGGGNANDRPLSSLSNTLQQGSARIFRGLSGSQPVGMRDSNSSLSSMNSEYDPNDPQAMFSRELRTAAGEYIFLRRFSRVADCLSNIRKSFAVSSSTETSKVCFPF